MKNKKQYGSIRLIFLIQYLLIVWLESELLLEDLYVQQKLKKCRSFLNEHFRQDQVHMIQ